MIVGATAITIVARSRSASSRSARLVGRWPLRRASTTPPTTAITSSTAVISNGQRKSVNRLFASVSTLPPSRAVAERAARSSARR